MTHRANSSQEILETPFLEGLEFGYGPHQVEPGTGAIPLFPRAIGEAAPATLASEIRAIEEDLDLAVRRSVGTRSLLGTVEEDPDHQLSFSLAADTTPVADQGKNKKRSRATRPSARQRALADASRAGIPFGEQ